MDAQSCVPKLSLKALLEGISDSPEIEITGISADSRKLEPGFAFFACKGEANHGLDFIGHAEAAGAAAVIWDSTTGSPVDSNLPMVSVGKLGNKMGEIANRWYKSPSKDVKVTGVTGTNGKTTVAFLISKALSLVDKKCGYIGTLGSGISQINNSGLLTTPTCFDLHELLAGFRDNNAGHAAVEVSSHALEQARVNGIKFDSAIFTNLSRDHIDYHGSMRAYFEAKARLFLDYDVSIRIVNVDTGFGTELANRCGANVVNVSTRMDRPINGQPHVSVRSMVPHESGVRIIVRSSWGEGEINLKLIGDFNVANALAVFALLLCYEIRFDEACAALGNVTAPPGRMEPIQDLTEGHVPQVYVDFSHTPASLEAALGVLRAHCLGELWCVFGCGGDRDQGKRPMMGEVVERLADHAIVTSDNPRSESPSAIINDILGGMDEYEAVIDNRMEAIAYAISNAKSKDIVLIAGKGHENYQLIGDRKIFFSDYQVGQENLRTRTGVHK